MIYRMAGGSVAGGSPSGGSMTGGMVVGGSSSGGGPGRVGSSIFGSGASGGIGIFMAVASACDSSPECSQAFDKRYRPPPRFLNSPDVNHSPRMRAFRTGRFHRVAQSERAITHAAGTRRDACGLWSTLLADSKLFELCRWRPLGNSGDPVKRRQYASGLSAAPTTYLLHGSAQERPWGVRSDAR